jgi:hypothetical protein
MQLRPVSQENQKEILEIQNRFPEKRNFGIERIHQYLYVSLFRETEAVIPKARGLIVTVN